MRTGAHSNKRNNSTPFVPTVQTQLQSRPWAEPTEAIADQIEAPELQKEPEERERFGHDLANIPIFAPAPETESADLPPIQAKFNDFITDSHPVAIADQIEAPELQQEPEDRERFGHNLANIPIFAPAAPPEEGEPPPIQTKGMTIGAPGDKYEQEADRVARKVVSEINRPVAQRVSEETELPSPGVISQDYSFLGRRKQSDGMVTTFGGEVQGKEAIASGEASSELTSAINTARGGGQPLDAGLQQSMGQAMKADFSRVRVHTDAQSDRLNQSLQAKAFTTGQDVFFRQGAYQPGSRAGQELIAHELTHVVQQNGQGGQADGEKADVAKKSDSKAVIQRMGSTFSPFSGGVKQAYRLTGLTLDTLFEQGLQYAQGGTKGNSVNLEKMISDSGGGSAPGEPQDITDIKQYDAGLVRANNQPNVATAMHAINHNFANPASTNLRPENIFMGSARSNTKEHFNKVELPIRNSMKRLTTGNAKKYEVNITTNPPTPLTSNPAILAWDNVGLDIPGVERLASPLIGAQAAPLPNVTHVLDTRKLATVTEPWPKMIQYQVTPNYTYQAHPKFPKFLLDNIQDAQNLVDAANLQPIPRPNQTEIDNEVWAINRLKAVGNNLFPETFTCSATYWFPTYDAAMPWKISSESDSYDAEV